MTFEKFKIVSPKDGQLIDNTFETLLINTHHIVSLKPIRMVVDETLVMGYWIRTTNGKKYRAVGIPERIKALLESDESDISSTAINVLGDDSVQKEFLN